jgi:hypothetical protein
MQREYQGSNVPPGMPKPSIAMQVEAASLQPQLDAMKLQLRRFTASGLSANESDLPNGGNARMYSTRAVCNKVCPMSGSPQLWLDGATKHVVSHTWGLFNNSTSHINEVIVAEVESHAVICCGSMIVEAASGYITFHQILCGPTIIVNLFIVP